MMDATMDGTTLAPGTDEEDEVYVFPVSFAQQRLWFLDRLEPGSTFYNTPLPVRLLGPLDVPALEAALSEIVRRHETLRTTFAVVDGQPVQSIASPRPVPLPVVELGDVAEEEREAAVQAKVAELVTRPFDLERGPLFQATLVRIAPQDHVLALAMHHILCDAWSIGVLMGEVNTLYEAFREGRESPLPEPAIQYADFAVWQREHLAGEGLERQLAFWKQHLAGAPPVLDLPYDRPRPAVQTYRGATVRADLSRATMDALTAFARRDGGTLFMVLLAAYKTVLGRWAGQENVVVGTPIAGRMDEETEALIGLFINTLAVHTDLSGDPTFRELVGRVREGLLGAYAHQELPFEKLVEEMHVERSLSHAPIFQVMMVLQNAPTLAGAAPLQGTEFAPMDVPRDTQKYDLTLNAAEHPEGVHLALSFSTDLFDAETVARLLDHLTTLLESVAADPNRRISRIPLSAADERETVLREWNRTERDLGPASTVHALFEAQARETPDATAVVFGDTVLTYAELDARAGRLARHLRTLGVGPDVPVAISVHRSAEMVVGMLGVMKAGGAYLPVDPAYPAERRAYMLEDSGARVVLTMRDLATNLPEHTARVVLLDAPLDVASPDNATASVDAGEAAGDAGIPVDADPSNLAYVIYTSGSTGRPKGVMVPHAGVCNLVRAQIEAFGLTRESRVLQFASYSFDASVSEIFPALLSGATLAVAPRESLMPGEPLRTTLREMRITFAKVPPSVLGAMPDADFPALATIASAGEACPADVARRWAAGRRYLNVYGPTETTVCATIGFGGDGQRRPPIGGPIANVRAYVLDAAGEPSPIGVPGEIFVGGAGVTRGYLGRPGLTAERFVPDPYSAQPGARMYRTGDRGRWLAGGTVDYLGRLDEQVKVRGFRIEPGEIESVLRSHPSVAEAAVIARPSDAGDLRLAAYVVPSSGTADVSPATLRAFVADRLPEHMVPAYFVALPALPLTPNRKLDRRALPAPDASLGAAAEFVAAQGAVEEMLSAVWREVLAVDRVGVNDNFFELGGHSLLLARVQSRIEEQIGRPVPMVSLFRFPTVRTLAAHLREGEPDDTVTVQKGRARADARRAARAGRVERPSPGS
ncbi:MAG TPA: amino acid adenylation domain-containing protein [Longimicrobiaceae bacterium]|jgi:amino acid adenylation domain-containing protein|nr:amino acid adenylation domain-containing protein [Longimicrobiaceae bacterium]